MRPVLAARLPLPDLIERGTATTLRCPVYLDGELAVPSSAHVQVLDRGGQVVAGGAASVVDGVAEYTVPGPTLASHELAEGWQVVWTLTVDGEVHRVRNEAALVRYRLHPVISDADLYERVPALSPHAPRPITDRTTYQTERDAAWVQIQRRLISQGRRPWLVLSPGALAEAHLTLTLALILEGLSVRTAEAISDRAAEYRRQYQDAWRQLSFVYDEPGGGLASAQNARRTPRAPIFLAGRR